MPHGSCPADRPRPPRRSAGSAPAGQGRRGATSDRRRDPGQQAAHRGEHRGLDASAVSGFRTQAVERAGDGRPVMVAEDGRRPDPVDEVVVLTGFHPDSRPPPEPVGRRSSSLPLPTGRPPSPLHPRELAFSPPMTPASGPPPPDRIRPFVRGHGPSRGREPTWADTPRDGADRPPPSPRWRSSWPRPPSP
ncbi:hypothetical protein CTU88_19980 [Streptomyces sp. JV178]|nr:hypothetical protein CTU88_19980 [Streptomyces sp. JV178]